MVFDLHNDLLTAKLSTDQLVSVLNDYQDNDIIDRVTLAVWTTKTPLPLSELPRLFHFASNHDKTDKFRLAIEDLHFITKANLDAFRALINEKTFNKILYAGLTWNFENSLAGGALSEGRLTELGKDVINALEEASVFVDTAHLNHSSFWDVLQHSTKPLINSHCCFSAIHKHPRNLSNEQIEAIIQRDGLIGLTFVNEFLSNNPARIVDSFKHIDYFINRFGYKNLALGTDFHGCTSYPIGLEDYSCLKALAQLMKASGYTSEIIEAVFSKNASRFFS